MPGENLEKSVLSYLRKCPNGASFATIEEGLGLNCSTLLIILRFLSREGKIKTRQVNEKRIFMASG